MHLHCRGCSLLLQRLYRKRKTLEPGERSEGNRTPKRCALLLNRRIANERHSHFSNVTENGARDLRSTEMEDGAKRQRRTIPIRRGGVAWFARWTRRQYTSAPVSAN